jgi:hypothetical protein
VDEIVQVLTKPHTSCIANLVGLPIADRPGFQLVDVSLADTQLT